MQISMNRKTSFEAMLEAMLGNVAVLDRKRCILFSSIDVVVERRRLQRKSLNWDRRLTWPSQEIFQKVKVRRRK